MKLTKWFLMGFLVLGISGSEVFGQANVYKLHSLFIYNFTKHIQWQETGGSFTIGVYGNDIAMNVLKENLENKKVWNQAINIVKVSSESDVTNCHMVYAPKSNRNKIISLIESANASNKLFVTEDDLIDFGAQISFFLKEDRLNFKISKNKCEQNGLKVSSALLTLGTQID